MQVLFTFHNNATNEIITKLLIYKLNSYTVLIELFIYVIGLSPSYRVKRTLFETIFFTGYK